MLRSMFATTTLASNGVPSLNVTSVRSVIVSWVPSSEYSYDVARFGSSTGPGLICNRLS